MANPLMDLLTSMQVPGRFGTAGQPSQDPRLQQQAMAQAAAMRQQMEQQAWQQRGVQQPAPEATALMQELEAKLNGGQQQPWVDSTGLGGRMDRLAALGGQGGQGQMSGPSGPSPNAGLLAQALQLAAGNAGALSRNQVTRNTGSGTYAGDVLESSGPLQSQKWYPEYLAAAQSGADLPMVRGNATESPEMLARRAAYGQAQDAERARRQSMVQSKAIAQGGDPNAIMWDNLRRLQEQGGQGGLGDQGDPTSLLGYLRNGMVAGGEYAQGAMQGGFNQATLAMQQQGERLKLFAAGLIQQLQNPAISPVERQQIMGQLQQIGGLGGMGVGQASQQMPSLAGMSPAQAMDQRWNVDPGIAAVIPQQWAHDNPGGQWTNPPPLPPGQTRGVQQPSLGDILNFYWPGGEGNPDQPQYDYHY